MNVTLACSEEVSDDVCIISDNCFDSHDRRNNKFAVLVAFKGGSRTPPPILLKALIRPSARAGLLLVSTKVYVRCAKVWENLEATVTIHYESSSLEKPDSIELYFLHKVDFLQWYEADNISRISRKWPKQLSLELVEKILPQLLFQSYLMHKSAFTISIFGQLFFFEVNAPMIYSDGAYPGFFIPDLLAKFHISLPSSDGSSPSLSYLDHLSFVQPILTDAIMSISHFLSTDLHSLVFHSTLYSSPQGSGKSTFFHLLRKYIDLQYKTTRVIYLDILTCLSSLSASSLQSDMNVQEILDIFIKLSSDKSSTNVNNAEYDATIIFIDHLDQVFNSFMSDLHDSVTAAAAAVVENFGYLLHHLLNLTKHTSNNKVMVMGACRMNQSQLPRGSTGCPDFERVITVPKPDEHDRLLLLQNLFDKHGIECSEVVKLAELTRGYLPGDLTRLVGHAISMTTGDDVTWEIVLQAISSSVCAPQALLDLHQLQQDNSSNTTANMSWDSFLGYSQVKHDLQRITRRLTATSSNNNNSNNKSNLLLLCSQPSRGMVLYGPSGCGKTHVCQILAHQMQMNLVTIQCTDLMSKYFGDTEAKIRNVFAAARAAAPCMLVFDNFEALAHRRGLDTGNRNGNPFASHNSESSSNSGNEEIGNRILSTFLNELDGIAAASTKVLEQSIFVVAACSDVKMLDEALIRPGRLQHHIHLDYPTLDDIFTILQHQLSDTALESSVNLRQLTERITKSKGMFTKVTSGQVIDICTSAKMAALEEVVEKYQLRDRTICANYEEEGKTFEEEMVCYRHFEKVLAPEVKASIPFKIFV